MYSRVLSVILGEATFARGEPGHGVRTPGIQSAYVAVRLCTITYGVRIHGILSLRETGLASLARMHVRVE